jgi:hypothetical protein
MLVCNVSQLRRRAAIAAGLVEAAAALDNPGTGNVVFATLVDDPASVDDRVDAYLGEIMLEAASADAAADAGLVYTAAMDEVATAIELLSGSVPTIWSAAVIEAAAASSIQDAALASLVIRTAMVAGFPPVRAITGVPARVYRLASGTALGV